MTPVASRRAPVTVHTDGDAVVLELSHALDLAAGRALLDAVSAAIAANRARVDIDLCSITGWTDDGAKALVQCRELCCDLPDGLHYRTGRGPGRDALLAAYA
jgi:hypothetical protein